MQKPQNNEPRKEEFTLKLLKWLEENLEESVCVILLIAITCVTFLQIVLRNLPFTASLRWPEEFCRYCFVASAFISMGYCYRKNCVLAVDILAQRLSPAHARILGIVNRLISIIFYAYMVPPAWNVAMNAKNISQLSPAMQIPVWFLYIFAPIGFFLGFARGVQEFVRFLRTPQGKEA